MLVPLFGGISETISIADKIYHLYQHHIFIWNTFLEINITKKLEFSSGRNFVSYLFLSEMFISKIVLMEV